MDSEEKFFMQLLQHYGPLGVFIVSALGNAIPYSTIPYLILIVIYAGAVKDPYHLLIITLMGGLGAAVGKIIVYYFGRGIRILLTEEQKKNLEVFTELFKRSTFLAVFLFAALPLPDDILYIPLGAMGYSLTRYFIALLLGKIIITGLAVFFGSSLSFLLTETSKLPIYIAIPILLVVTLLLTYIVAKINWVYIADTYKTEGIIRGTIALLYETGKALITLVKRIIKLFRTILRSISLHK